MNAQQLLLALLEMQANNIDLSAITLMARTTEYTVDWDSQIIDIYIDGIDDSELSQNRITFV
jgi:hypothetical protein